MLSLEIDSTRFPQALAISSTNVHTSIGMSSIRSRSAGTWIGKMFNR